MSVVTQLNVASNRQTDVDANMMKAYFRAAYFLFKNEVPHTTTWRPLISTIAACEGSGSIHNYLQKCPANAHHLSQNAVTDILESYGEAMTEEQKVRLSGIKEFAIMADECTDINRREMLSLCVRIVEDSLIKEVFIGCWPVRSTTADVITDAILEGIQSASLDPTNIVAVSFDGASNMSGSKKGVQALLKVHAPKLVFVHCRSHLLQLALVRAAGLVPDVKRTLSMLSKLYSLFQHSPKRLNVLLATEVAIDGLSHKLVQPGETRWLSYEGSVAVVCKHYAAICLALESIYVEAGDLSCDAGGLLLVLRKHSTLSSHLPDLARHFRQAWVICHLLCLWLELLLRE
jgi:hypothetical protein